MILVSGFVPSAAVAGEYAVESNVVYGMVSGTALLLDVYRPEDPNGIGVIHISGSGWHAPAGYHARPLKHAPHVDIFVKPLAAKGFTLFTINHRAAPAFRYPAAVEDAQRAVRFIRHHAPRFGIDPTRIGAVGGSSGGHLVAMLGLLDGEGLEESADPVERVSAKVQCVVARAAPVSLYDFSGTGCQGGRFLLGDARYTGISAISLSRSFADQPRLSRRPAIPVAARRPG